MAAPRRMPVLFVGHGNPLNAITDNAWSRGWQRIGATLPRPRAILCVSAHWYLPGTFTTANHDPPTIHDFGGFPKALYEVQYGAAGDPALAARVADLLGAFDCHGRNDWGLDHGTWSVLTHMFPDADVPVVQLSIDTNAAPDDHVAIGEALSPLRDDGVLVMGSGNIVHNLGAFFRGWQAGDQTIPGWAEAFDHRIRDMLLDHDRRGLAHALDDETGKQAHPSPDHYLPLLYAAGAAGDDEVSFPVEGFDASISMRCVRFG